MKYRDIINESVSDLLKTIEKELVSHLKGVFGNSLKIQSVYRRSSADLEESIFGASFGSVEVGNVGFLIVPDVHGARLPTLSLNGRNNTGMFDVSSVRDMLDKLEKKLARKYKLKPF